MQRLFTMSRQTTHRRRGELGARLPPGRHRLPDKRARERICIEWHRLSAEPNFSIAGASRAITFPESLYFSIVTMATVGYGDIVPASDGARALAALQVVLGVLLLLVGFSEIFSYTRERQRPRGED